MTKLVVAGLRSIGDAHSVEEILRSQPGVTEVKVGMANKVATIRHSAIATAADLIHAVEGAGFYARRAVAGEGSAEYASSPWGALRQGGLTPQGEMVMYRALTVLGGLIILAMFAVNVLLQYSDQRAFMLLVLAVVAQSILGWRFYAKTWRFLLLRRIDADALVAAATTALFGLSAYHVLSGQHDTGMLYFRDTAIMLTAVCAGRWADLWLRMRSGRSLRDLVDMAPLGARVLKDGREEDVLSCDLMPGDLVVVRPGERFPADGMIVDGRGAADESLLTGEALPVTKHPGSPALGGTVNGHGHVVMRVGRAAGDTALARMVQMVSHAEHIKPSVYRTAHRLAGMTIGLALLTSLAALMVVYASTGLEDRGAVIMRVVAVLACACPWAMLLAVPDAISAALGRAARLGILIRSGRAIEQCAAVKTVVFDLGGTVTLGQPELIESRCGPGCRQGEMLELAAGLAGHSQYPLDEAVCAAARVEGVPAKEIGDFCRIPGRGLRGRTADGEVFLGSRRFMDEQGIYLGELADFSDQQEANGRRVLILACKGRAVGLFVFEDPLQPGARHTAERLQAMGLSVWLISSGTRAMAKATAAQAGIPAEHVLAEVPHDERPARIRQLSAEHGPLAMVGDPGRDGPALVEADVGIAIGCGARTSAAGAEVLLVGSDLRGVLRALRMSRRTMNCITLSLVFTMLYNLVALPLAVTGLLQPAYAAVAMVLAALLVAVNSFRLSLRPGAGTGQASARAATAD